MTQFAEYNPRPNAMRGNESQIDPTIRPAELTDLEHLLRMAHAREGGDRERERKRLIGWIERSGESERNVILVAEVEGGVIGYGATRFFVPPGDAPPDCAPAGWYLSGVVIDPQWRRRGVGRGLTRRRLQLIAEHDRLAYYFANALNRASIELHKEFGFREISRAFWFPKATFTGGVGILFQAAIIPIPSA